MNESSRLLLRKTNISTLLDLRLVVNLPWPPLRKPSPMKLKSHGWGEIAGPVCPAEDTEKIYSSTSLRQNLSEE